MMARVSSLLKLRSNIALLLGSTETPFQLLSSALYHSESIQLLRRLPARGSAAVCSNIAAETQPAYSVVAFEQTFGRLAWSSSRVRSYATDSASKAAAVRRLAAAKARKEKEAALVPAQSQAASSVSAEAVQSDALVTPVEGKATDLQLATVLQRPALIITRPIEWGQVIFGYEQANKYTVYDEAGNIVALMAEDYTGIGSEIGKQLLRSRRSFTSTVFSADGSQVLFRVRRPVYLINSSMFVEDGEGNQVGEIKMRWHPLKRNYDLYYDKRQFAAITGNFLAWEFELKDTKGSTLALIDRNFSGFGKEIFTDAGKYAIHFGMDPQHAADVATQTVHSRVAESHAQPAPGSNSSSSSAGAGQQAQQQPLPRVTPMALARTDALVIPTVTGNQLAVGRSLELSERMITLACAITIDYDYFSQHSRMGGGLFGPPIIMPMPFPGGGGGGEAAGAAAGAEGGGGGGGEGAVAGGAVSPGGSGGFDSGAAAAGGSGAAADGGFGGGGGGDAGWSQGDDQGMFGGQQPGGDGEMKWDMPESGGGGGGGEGAEGAFEGAKQLLGQIWEIFGGGGD